MFVNAHKAGQLANCLVHGSHLVAAALEHGHRVANPGLLGYAAYFPATRDDLLCRFPARRSRLPHGPRARRALYRLVRLAVPTLRRLPLLGPRVRAVVWRDLEAVYRLDGPEFAALAGRGGLLLFEGWNFRSGAVEAHAEAIRRYFTPLPEHLRRVEEVVGPLREGPGPLVGVHVRRGDYAGHLGGRYFWEVGAYAALVRRLAGAFPGRRPAFLVCSNERLDPALFEGLPVTFGPGHLIEDLYAFARCDYLVGPPSTYTLWASFYGRVPLRHLEAPGDEVRPEDFRIASI